MRRMSLILLACLIASFAAAQDSRPAGAAAASGPAVSVPTFQNETCPAMGKPAKADLFVETDNGRVYVCCKMCLKKVEADKAGMYKKAYASSTPAGNKTCPISGEPVDAKSPKVTVQGVEFSICCNDCSKPLLENAQIYLAKAKNPKINDLGNKTDPISGKAVGNNLFCLIGDDLVHLSSADSAAEVMKDPKKALEKAKAAKPAEEKKDGEKKGGPHEAGGCCSGKADADEGGCCSGASKAKALTESRPAK
jgi:hypothetical protein